MNRTFAAAVASAAVKTGAAASATLDLHETRQVVNGEFSIDRGLRGANAPRLPRSFRASFVATGRHLTQVGLVPTPATT